MEALSTSSPLQKLSFIEGSQPLWKAFWVLYVLGSLSFSAIAVVLIKLLSTSHVLLQVSHALNLKEEAALIVAITAIAMIYLIYFVFCSISIWRCSRNTMKKSWMFLARFTISIHFSWISWKVFVDFSSLVTYFSHQSTA
ncbi:MAG: hypothetical protein ACK5NQ_05215 [Pseudomonas sp.]